ncbi:MAG TPA: hypothetical protein VMD30_07375 [Tepidisphaeraceae bacterium]|nr:hypothetical protein [Tepidisphaeraceae bacterium]
MSSITEIEAAIEKLPRAQVEELATWLDSVLNRRPKSSSMDCWLKQARGAAQTRMTTTEVMALTRGDE